MIAGIGTDIVEVKRIKRLIQNSKFLNRCFTEKEIEYFKSRNLNPQTIAGAFCAKEAFSKAIGTGIRFPFKAVEVLHDGLGKPYISTKLNCEYSFHLSISHTKEYALAFVIAEKK